MRRTGIRVHRSGRLAAEEVTVRSGIPVTTVPRTLLDLADVLDRQALRRVVTEAEYTNRLDLTTLTAVVQNNPGRRGRKVMEAVEGRMHRTRSPLEDRFLSLLEQRGVKGQSPPSGSRATKWTSCGDESTSCSSSTASLPTPRARRCGVTGNGIACCGGPASARCG